MLSIMKIFGNKDSEEEMDGQLWVMIKESDYFRDDSHLKIIDEITEIIEGSDLGELDGHSSGAYQLEINFFDVGNYDKAKATISSYLESKHPKLEFIISNDYETTYEKP